MKIFTIKLMLSYSVSCFKRNLYFSSIYNSYDGDGKTTLSILNKNFDYGLMIDNVSEHGFVLNNGIKTLGPMIIFPKTILSWNIASSADMNEQSLSLILNLEPKLDILVIGLDDKYPHNASFLLTIKETLNKYKILSEILPIYRACSTFNFLNSENRYAAAALIPPKLKYSKDLLLHEKGNEKLQKELSKTSKISFKPINHNLSSDMYK